MGEGGSGTRPSVDSGSRPERAKIWRAELPRSGPGPYAMVDGCVLTEKNNNRVRHASGTGRITTIAGNGSVGSAGDGGLATLAELNVPVAVAVTVDGGILIATLGDSRVRFVDAGLS